MTLNTLKKLFNDFFHVCIVLVLADHFLVTCVSAYELGDPIPMVIRTGMGTSPMPHWDDVQSSVSPMFGVNSQALITPEFQKRPLSMESEFRIAFSFSRHQFELDFIQIADGVGGFAQEIVFYIEFAARDMHSVRHHIVQFDQPPLSPPETITLTYVWHKLPSTDPECGTFAIFLITVVTAVLGAALSMSIHV